MADHDREVGSRGDEEAPRDPDPGAQPPPSQDATAHASPGWSPPPAAPRPDTSFRDFLRQKPTQIIGAALIGLIVGGLLGGTAVALVVGVTHHDRVVPWGPRFGWDPYQDWEHMPRAYPDCRPAPGGTYCRYGAPYPPMPSVVPVPSVAPVPPSWVPPVPPTPTSTLPSTQPPTTAPTRTN
ncbi:hypothetical protein [Nonomuraea roseoviolacea]|uniref:Uncharacterized protein n=1 Tax=Nonomuraea roseoviolacea subsp. carminata TaxID=160689 RepID=A0ABT1JUD2_9ACTN|nr:hypothetical protein [Nonomuraea roseoviolacea]MCP2345320.1 hypothetical protein [Nonomuraea roseoviolacea subsp. carminata]